MTVDVGEAEHVRGEARLRIEAVRLALDREARLAERVDRLDQRRRCAAAEVEERLARAQHREILLFALLGHQPRKRPRERELVADHLCRVDRDRPRVDRPRERLAVAVDDVAAVRNERGQPFLAAGMVTEGREIEDAQRDDRDHAGIDEHAEHQPLVHDGEHLPPLTDKSEPLGPWRDESGRRCVHRPGRSSLDDLAWTMLVRKRSKRIDLRKREPALSPAWPCARTGLSTDFFAPAWAAARPGLSADFFGCRLRRRNRLVRGLGAGRRLGRHAATGFAGTSRVSVFRLAS